MALSHGHIDPVSSSATSLCSRIGHTSNAVLGHSKLSKLAEMTAKVRKGDIYADLDSFYAACQACGRSQHSSFEGTGFRRALETYKEHTSVAFACMGRAMPMWSVSKDAICSWRVTAAGVRGDEVDDDYDFKVSSVCTDHSSDCRLAILGNVFAVVDQSHLVLPVLPPHQLGPGSAYDSIDTAFKAIEALGKLSRPAYRLVRMSHPRASVNLEYRCAGVGDKGCSCRVVVQRVLQGADGDWMMTELVLGHAKRCAFMTGGRLPKPPRYRYPAAEATRKRSSLDAIEVSDDESEDDDESGSCELSAQAASLRRSSSASASDRSAKPSKRRRLLYTTASVDHSTGEAHETIQTKLLRLFSAHLPALADRLPALVEHLVAKGVAATLLLTLSATELTDLLTADTPPPLRAIAHYVKGHLPTSLGLPLQSASIDKVDAIALLDRGKTDFRSLLTRLHFRLGDDDVVKACQSAGLDAELLSCLSADELDDLLDVMDELDGVCKVLLKRRVAIWRAALS